MSSDGNEALKAVSPDCLKVLIPVDDVDFIKLHQHNPLLSPVVINYNDWLWFFARQARRAGQGRYDQRLQYEHNGFGLFLWHG